MYHEASKRASIAVAAHGLARFPIFSFVVDAKLALKINFYAPTAMSDFLKHDRRRRCITIP